jgi:IS30 family transposase
MKFRQLTIGDRYIIECLLYRRLRQKEIAEVIGFHPSTISREVRRNREEGSRYFGCWAERRALLSASFIFQ